MKCGSLSLTFSGGVGGSSYWGGAGANGAGGKGADYTEVTPNGTGNTGRPGGGAGGTAIKFLSVTPGDTFSVTIGSGGSAGAYGGSNGTQGMVVLYEYGTI